MSLVQFIPITHIEMMLVRQELNRQLLKRQSRVSHILTEQFIEGQIRFESLHNPDLLTANELLLHFAREFIRRMSPVQMVLMLDDVTNEDPETRAGIALKIVLEEELGAPMPMVSQKRVRKVSHKRTTKKRKVVNKKPRK